MKKLVEDPSQLSPILAAQSQHKNISLTTHSALSTCDAVNSPMVS